MARFSFGKRNQEDDEIPPEPGESDADVSLPPEEEPSGTHGRSRRLLMLAGIVALLGGGYYFADQWFFAPPPPPPLAPRPAVPPAAPKAPMAPQTPAPAVQAAPAKEAPAPPAKVEAKAVPAVPQKAAPAAPAKAEPPPAAKSAPTKTEPKTAQAGQPAAAGFSLQVGAMVMQENAENLKRKLDGAGFPAIIRKGSAFVTRHVVTVADPAGRREADELARRLNVDGFPSQIVAVEGKFTPQIGAFFNLDEAIDLARELQKKSYPPKITSKPATTVVYQIRHGQFESRAAALKRSEDLKAKGFAALVVRN